MTSGLGGTVVKLQAVKVSSTIIRKKKNANYALNHFHSSSMHV